MKKIIFPILVFICCTACGQSGKQLHVSAGAEIGYTTGEKVALWGTGIGGSVLGEYFFREKFSGTLLAGYVSYLGFSIRGTYKLQSFSTVPIRAGVRYYFSKKIYGGAQAGIGILSGGANLIGAAGTAFSYSPQVGYKFALKKRSYVDVSLKYDGYSYSDISFGAAGLRIAYGL